MVTQKRTRSADGEQSSTAESLRELVIRAGIEVLERDGLQLRPESISYAKVFAYLEQEYSVRVTRGSVHERIWDSHEDFRRDVLMQTLQHLPLDAPARTELASEAVLSEVIDECLEDDQPVERFAFDVGRTLWHASSDSETFAAIQSLKAIASRFNDPLTAEVLHDELDRRDQIRLVSRPQIISTAMHHLNRTGRATMGISQLEISRTLFLLMDTLLVGGHLNLRAGCPDPMHLTGYRPAGWEGDQRWPLASVAFLVFLELFTEEMASGSDTSAGTPEAIAPSIEEHPPVELDAISKVGQRRSREELRKLVLAAGQELLLRDGLALQPEALRYSSVLSYIGEQHDLLVNRASIHGRIWETHNEFCLDVLAASVDSAPISEPEVEAERGAQEAPTVDLEPGEDRHQVVVDRIRRWLLFQVELLSNDPSYRQRLLIKAALVDKTESRGMDNLRRAIQETDRERLDFNREMFVGSMLSLGFAVRPGLGLTNDEAIDTINLIVQAMVVGAVFNRLSGIDTGVRRFNLRRDGGGGESDEWNLPGVAARACFEHLFAAVPDEEVHGTAPNRS